MAGTTGPFGNDDDAPRQERPWGVIAAVAAFILLGIFALWVTHEKSSNKARQEVLTALDKELTDEEEAIKAQREKVMDLTRQIESLRAAISSGQAANGKAAIAEFKQLVAQQHIERDKFTQMAEAYNKKVAQYRNLEQ